MKHSTWGSAARRAALGLALLGAMALSAAARTAAAQTAWPDRPIRIVVGFPAGGASDVAARAVGQKLGERLGVSVVVENRPGAGSNIGIEAVARSPADGYTLLFGTIASSVNPSLHPKLPYDPIKDFDAVAQIASTPFLLLVNPGSGMTSVADLLARARAGMGAGKELQYATAGNGSGSHLFVELFASMAGIRLTHVPYRGAAPAMNDVLGGQVPIAFDNIIPTLPLVKTGKLTALAVSTRTRSSVAPDIPTLDEAGVKGFDATAWFGFFVPAGTPGPIIDRLSRETAEALKDKDVRERLLGMGAEPVGSSPAEFDAFYRGELQKWARVVREANIKVD